MLLGWNVNVRDSDGHNIEYDMASTLIQPNIKEPQCTIGNHVWLASYVDILRGVGISDESVVAYRSCVTKSFNDEACLIAGYPAKVIRKNIKWTR